MLALDGGAVERSATRRLVYEENPFYAIAHHCNSERDAAVAFRTGANAIEFDVRFSKRHKKFCVNHNTDLFCERDELGRYLRGLKSLAHKYGEQAALVVADFKDAGGNEQAGAQLLEIIRNELTAATGIKAILSVPFLTGCHRGALSSAVPTSGEALAVDEENDAHAVASYFRERRVVRAAYANGTFALGIGPNIRPSVERAVSIRGAGGFNFVYVWTLAKYASMAAYAAMGVNGIIVNDPLKLRQAIAAARLPIRYATRADNPFP